MFCFLILCHFHSYLFNDPLLFPLSLSLCTHLLWLRKNTVTNKQSPFDVIYLQTKSELIESCIVLIRYDGNRTWFFGSILLCAFCQINWIKTFIEFIMFLKSGFASFLITLYDVIWYDMIRYYKMIWAIIKFVCI